MEQKVVKELSYRQKIKDFPPKFSEFFVGKQYIVSKHQYYDSDTILGVISIEGKEVSFSFRLLGYDAVEKKQKKADISHLSTEDITLLKDKYQESENLLSSLISGKQLTIQCGQLDLYGRLLANIYVQDQNGLEIHVNQKMIDSGLVFKYNGATKLTIDQQVEFFKQQHSH